MKLVHTAACAIDHGLHRQASNRHRRQQQTRHRAARRRGNGKDTPRAA